MLDQTRQQPHLGILVGTIITLTVEGLDVTWSKNRRGPDHGALFQATDRSVLADEEVEEGEDAEGFEAAHMGFQRKLRDVVPRLELLGYTLDRARNEYDAWVEEWREDRETMWDDEDKAVEPMSFDEFFSFVCRYPVGSLDNHYDEKTGDEERKGRFNEEAALLKRIPRGWDHDDGYYSERSFFGTFVNILDPYCVLRILAGNEANLNSEVIWQYGWLVEAGWATVDEFRPLARRRQTFLIATEGTSDGHILEQAFKLLRPGIADFFRFIDVTERHPFSGTGNLVKFAEGLVKIDVQNQTVLLFDNDAEGVEARGKLSGYNLPSNMRSMLLPDLDAFRSFPASGPNGDHLADINGRAAAIECYLDHRLHHYPSPKIVWTSYKREAGIYQGALEHKDSYTKAFLKLKHQDLGSYDTTNIEKVLDAIVTQCTAIASLSLGTEDHRRR